MKNFEGRKNDGGNFMAVPPKAPGGTEDKEAEYLDARGMVTKQLEDMIVALEKETGGRKDHPKYQRLEELREELRTRLN